MTFLLNWPLKKMWCCPQCSCLCGHSWLCQTTPNDANCRQAKDNVSLRLQITFKGTGLWDAKSQHRWEHCQMSCPKLPNCQGSSMLLRQLSGLPKGIILSLMQNQLSKQVLWLQQWIRKTPTRWTLWVRKTVSLTVRSSFEWQQWIWCCWTTQSRNGGDSCSRSG